VARQTAVVFCMPDRGHFQRLRSIIAGLAARGVRVLVFTGPQFGAEVAAAGGECVNLFARRTVDEADDESWPPVCRYITFAGAFAEEIRDEVGRVAPSLVVHDTFAVAGHVAGRMLGIPYVNVCAGHDVVPERFLAILRAHPRVHVSERCRRAVERLWTEHGLHGLSPFSYVTAFSPHLNLYGEPHAFLPDEDRGVFEPVAFYGSLAEDSLARGTPADRAAAARRWFGDGAERALRLYVSFGTAIWMSRTAEALSALQAISTWAGGQPGVRALISLGKAQLTSAQVAPLTRGNVAVVPYADQWSVLAVADVFVTHHGLNSTHEAIAQEVPMISYPFVWDQPGLAAACQRFGLAEPLADGVMAPIGEADVASAVERVTSRGPEMRQALATAHEWEREVIAGRPGIIDRMMGLMS
jgi:UDP:flavonoid glycosyltransferase YjiC (YdhE family)